jgi:hypothetical protein
MVNPPKIQRMGTMKQIEAFRHELVTLLPKAQIIEDPPDDPHGRWFFDIQQGRRLAVVE